MSADPPLTSSLQFHLPQVLEYGAQGIDAMEGFVLSVSVACAVQPRLFQGLLPLANRCATSSLSLEQAEVDNLIQVQCLSP